MTKRGFAGIGIFHPKFDENIGTLFRSAYAFGADFVFTVGRKYKRQASDTCNATLHVPYFHYDDYEAFRKYSPKDARPVVIELDTKSHKLKNFIHPERAIYILGSEGGNLPRELINKNLCVEIETKTCLNVAVAGSIVLAHRNLQHG